jgi:hypothetical protein
MKAITWKRRDGFEKKRGWEHLTPLPKAIERAK